MSLKLYLIGMGLGTILCLASFILVIVYINPQESPVFGPAALFASLFLGLTGLFTLIGYFLRVIVSKNEVLFSHIAPSFRQGILLAAGFTGLFILQAFRILTWWDALILIAMIILFEFYFLSR